ncbi:hypothetical protein PLICRDRAFT_449441 [Plicaturopsis crispa FD-325 SS-3]|uniref:Uncharacterized protein n=1 Tax=Plicaturopsis crispa FD-325 SS-3 TaxID=944288 RepID=A0A0C9SW78_PLICR|nr:hypothetical protein PLICRDRAFT_449441 [Plicaturopsis crispa FD-325 SS-3]
MEQSPSVWGPTETHKLDRLSPRDSLPWRPRGSELPWLNTSRRSWHRPSPVIVRSHGGTGGFCVSVCVSPMIFCLALPFLNRIASHSHAPTTANFVLSFLRFSSIK